MKIWMVCLAAALPVCCLAAGGTNGTNGTNGTVGAGPAKAPELTEWHRAIFCGADGASETSGAYAAAVAEALSRRTARGLSVRDAVAVMQREWCATGLDGGRP